MKDIVVNTSLTLSKVVKPEDSAIKVGSGLVDVFATPAMIALAEKTASEALKPYLEAGEVSVGVNINIDHVAATKIGKEVKATATITSVDKRKVTFTLLIVEGDKVIGQGKHIRCVVNKQKFIERLN